MEAVFSASIGFLNAPSRIRTCDTPLRRRMLYPLSYGRIYREWRICPRLAPIISISLVIRQVAGTWRLHQESGAGHSPRCLRRRWPASPLRPTGDQARWHADGHTAMASIAATSNGGSGALFGSGKLVEPQLALFRHPLPSPS